MLSVTVRVASARHSCSVSDASRVRVNACVSSLCVRAIFSVEANALLPETSAVTESAPWTANGASTESTTDPALARVL